MKQWVVHYMNKYPKAHITSSESSIDVYDAEGNYCVALRKDGGGNFVDRSEEMGCKDRHDLSPIPKESRLYKVSKEGHISKDEKFESRDKLKKQFMKGSKVSSCEELTAEGFSFDEKQRMLQAPAKEEKAVQAAPQE